jgi:hypothetical protein
VTSAALHRYRLAIVRLCCCALLLLGAGAQLHGLAHAVQAAQAAQAVAEHGATAAHAQACEQCLQYAAIDGAMPVAAAQGALSGSASRAGPEPVTTRVAATFVAYRSRAPPAVA